MERGVAQSEPENAALFNPAPSQRTISHLKPTPHRWVNIVQRDLELVNRVWCGTGRSLGLLGHWSLPVE